jgi:hypothetical protein
MNNPEIFSLYPEDCVGGDIGKHNYNALYLESLICNLSSRFFAPDITITPFLSSYNGESWNQVLSGFLNRAPILSQFNSTTYIHQAYTAVSLLSSYWSSHEFSVTYPVNLNFADATSSWWQKLRCPHVESPMMQLIMLAKSYLDVNFPSENYLKNTKVHVTMFLYSNHASPFKTDLDNLITYKTRVAPSVDTFNPPLGNDYSNTPLTYVDFDNRFLETQLSRKDVHFKYGLILSFVQGGANWSHVNIFGGNFDPNTTNRSVVTIELKQNVYNYDIGEAVKGNTLVKKNNDPNNSYLSFNPTTSSSYIPGYVPGATDVILVVQPNVEIGSFSPDLPALFLGNLPDGDTVTLFNYGRIIGAGGEGGNGGDSPGSGTTRGISGGNGKRGGTAVCAFVPAIIENRGSIYGGGGGGGGGTGGISGANSVGGGGGGGGGRTPGPSGYRGSNPLYKRRNLIRNSTFLRDGSSGKNFQGGEGGAGIVAAIPAASKAAGGRGGDLGMPGENSNSSLGGDAGCYIVGNSNVFWALKGDVLGSAI